MATVIKLRGIQNPQRQTALIGNIITFKKANDVLLEEINEMNSEITSFPRPEAAKRTLSVVFVRAKLSCASLIPTAYKTSSIQVNPDKIYKWCEIKKKIDRLWKDIPIDNSPEMTERLKLIPKMLIDSATCIESDEAAAVEELIEKLSKQQPLVNIGEAIDKTFNQSTEEQSVFITTSTPRPEENHFAEKLLLKSKRFSVYFLTHKKKHKFLFLLCEIQVSNWQSLIQRRPT